MGKIYLEQVLEQLVDKADVIIRTKETEAARSYSLGNHCADKWLMILESKFPCGHFKVLNVDQRVRGSSLTWIITIDNERDWVTDRLEQLSNCIISGLDY